MCEAARCMQVTGTGLSGVVEAQLGVCLDKSLQCSSWGSRPLSPEQLQYAALDAAVLLMLLNNVICVALPSTVARLSSTADTQNSANVPSATKAPEQQSAGPCEPLPHRDGTHCGSASSQGHRAQQEQSAAIECEADKTLQALNGLSLHFSSGTAALQEHEAGHRDRCLPQQGMPEGASDSDSIKSQRTVTKAELHEASQVWGIRLEVGRSSRQKLPKLRAEKRPGVRELFSQDAASDEQIGGS